MLENQNGVMRSVRMSVDVCECNCASGCVRVFGYVRACAICGCVREHAYVLTVMLLFLILFHLCIHLYYYVELTFLLCFLEWFSDTQLPLLFRRFYGLLV